MYVLLKNKEVIKEKVYENDRKAAKTPLSIYYAKWNDRTLQICLWQIECQQSLNNFWPCKWGNWNVIWSVSFIIKVLVAFMGKNAIDDITTISWKWASTDNQWFLVCQGHWIVIWSLLCIPDVLAVFIGKKWWDTVTAPMRNLVTTQRQQFLALHLG